MKERPRHTRTGATSVVLGHGLRELRFRHASHFEGVLREANELYERDGARGGARTLRVGVGQRTPVVLRKNLPTPDVKVVVHSSTLLTVARIFFATVPNNQGDPRGGEG